MNNDMNDKLFELYTLAELKYKRHFDNVNDNTVSDLFLKILLNSFSFLDAIALTRLFIAAA